MDEASGCAPRQPAVGGTLLDALDAALTAAWDDDALVEAFVHDEGLVDVVVNLELAIETLRSALERLSPPGRAAPERDRGLSDTDGSRANRIRKEGRPNE